jgi:6-pyruvoyltetrahydropterin/6-carboxytetrahydropterin synthase
MFAVEVQATFSAAHALRLPGGTGSGGGGGGGSSEPLHGHDFRVSAVLSAQALDSAETVVDFHLVEELLRQVIGPFQNRTINEVYPFTSRVNPSAERIAEQIGLQLQGALQARLAGEMASRGLRVAEVRVTEAPGCQAIWRP